MNLKKFFILALFFGSTCPAFCSGDTLRCRFYFPVGGFTPDLSYRANGSRLDSFLSGRPFPAGTFRVASCEPMLRCKPGGESGFEQTPV